MAPARSKKQNTSDQGIPAFPAPPTNTISKTPQRSPAKRMAGVTQRQKQALIDHLQSEITERARRLRAQYAEHAQELRARVERRVNRIPQGMKKRTMQDLMDEHAAKAKPAPPPPIPVVNKAPPAPAPAAKPAPVPVLRAPSKRKSDEISNGDDKENMPSHASDGLANPKKRTKTTVAVANSKATRTASRKADPAAVGPAGVLSPKSHNSRTYPQSPFKSSNLAPEKPQTSRPGSAAATKPAIRAPSRQTKRNGPQADLDGRTSEASNSSAGTTIVTKPVTRKAPVPKKPAAAKTTAARKPAAAPKQDPPPTRAGRTLRSRN